MLDVQSSLVMRQLDYEPALGPKVMQLDASQVQQIPPETCRVERSAPSSCLDLQGHGRRAD